MRELDKLHIIYTPFMWVQRCHSEMTALFGSEWRDQVVWDLSCGDRAMTRDFVFTNLHSSDIRPEVEPDFVYDATALDEQKLPSEIATALRNRQPIIIFTNTPFGRVGDRIRKMIISMKQKYNARIIFACITNMFWSSKKEFDDWADNFWYLRGFMFPSTEFPELKAKWPVLFSVWISREEEE